MGTERVLDEVLAVVLDAAIETTGAERGFIMLADEQGTLEMSVARHAGRGFVEASDFKTSRKIPEQVFATGQLQVVADLLEGDLPETHTQTVAFGIRHVLCLPLRLVRYVERLEDPGVSANIGVLYLDSKERGRFSSSASVALEALATEAATAIENARLYRETVEKAKIDEELRTASKIQQALLPPPRREGAFYRAVGASVPSRMIGGDFFDYLDLSGDVFGFALGDESRDVSCVVLNLSRQRPGESYSTVLILDDNGGRAQTDFTALALADVIEDGGEIRITCRFVSDRRADAE